MSAVICQGCIWPNKPVFLIAVMSWVDPGNGFRNIKDLACLVGEYFKGYALLCGVSRCTKFLAFFHHQHGTSVPSNTYSRWGLSSLGLGGGGSTMSRILSTLLIALEIVGWDVPKIPAGVCCLMFSCR